MSEVDDVASAVVVCVILISPFIFIGLVAAWALS